MELEKQRVMNKISSFNVAAEDWREIKSWIFFMRNLQGLSGSQLARKLGINKATLSQREKAEREGRITVNKLRDFAESLDCQLFYCFIPRSASEPFEEIEEEYLLPELDFSID